MSLTGIVTKAEQQGETLFQVDRHLSTELRAEDIVSDLEHSRAHDRSAIAKIQDYPLFDLQTQAELVEYLSTDLKRKGKTIMRIRREMKNRRAQP